MRIGVHGHCAVVIVSVSPDTRFALFEFLRGTTRHKLHSSGGFPFIVVAHQKVNVFADHGVVQNTHLVWQVATEQALAPALPFCCETGAKVAIAAPLGKAS
jgi:hypothetical protein